MSDGAIWGVLLFVFCAGILIGLAWGRHWAHLDSGFRSVERFDARRRALGPRSLP